MHIDYRKAPLVIQRFGDVKMLVDQTLDPMVSAYFKNIGQTKTLIQIIQERNEIQQTASNEMRAEFEYYNLDSENRKISDGRTKKRGLFSSPGLHAGFFLCSFSGSSP